MVVKNRKLASPEDDSALRRRAEGVLGKGVAGGGARGDPEAREGPPSHGNEPGRLLHDLEVYRIELETQNDELRTTRRAAELALARYATLYELAPIGYVVLSIDGIIQEVNASAARTLQAAGRVVGTCPFSTFVSPEHQGLWKRYLTRVHEFDEGMREACELSIVCERGPVTVNLTAARLVHPEPSILLAMEDVSERRRAEAAVREAASRKDEFLAVLSHELRNPLAPITNGLRLLETAAPGSDQASRVQATITRQVGHLTRIVDDLLDVTRIARGKVHLQLAQVELVELVRRTVDDHRATFERCGIRVRTCLGERPLFVKADATRLVQVLGNLLGNAAKFTPRGGEVSVQVERGDGDAVVRVVDTGVGITDEDMKRLFVPFAQAAQTLERTRGGLGLGLAMVKGLVELHGGSVHAASGGRGAGAEVVVRLPLVERPTLTPPPMRPSSYRCHRVLVIEDNVDAANTLGEVLEMRGQEARIAYDGPTGLALAQTFRPEVVFCDIGLPGMDGYEVARAFRRDQELRSVRLVALSGYAQPEDLQRASEAGFDEHVAKPARLERLDDLMAALP